MTLKKPYSLIKIKPKLGLEGKKAYLKRLKNKRLSKRKKQTKVVNFNIIKNEYF